METNKFLPVPEHAEILLTVPEYASCLRFVPKHVYNLISNGRQDQLPTKVIRIGKGPKAAIRFSKRALDQWIADQS